MELNNWNNNFCNNSYAFILLFCSTWNIQYFVGKIVCMNKNKITKRDSKIVYISSIIIIFLSLCAIPTLGLIMKIEKFQCDGCSFFNNFLISRLEQPQSTKFPNPVKSTIPSDIFYLLSY